MFGLFLIAFSLLIFVFWGKSGWTTFFKVSLLSPTTFKLLFSVWLILIIGKLMKFSGHLKGMLDAFHRLFRDNRIGIILPPALIGLLPMPGGAMFSAPMVEESSSDVNMSPAQKTYINYWFRHIWEYGWPLYPGLIIAASLLNINVSSLVRSQAIFILAPITIGIIYVFFKIERKVYPMEKKKRYYLYDIFKGIWPILYILIFSVWLSYPIVLVLFSLTIIMIIVYRRFGIIIEFFKEFPFTTTILIVGIMMFKVAIQDSQLLNSLTFLYDSYWGKYIMLIFLPFIWGIATGVNQAYVAISFPVLMPLFISGNNDINFANVALAYISGFEGVLLSPVHLCLSLSKEYYGAKFKDVYRLLLPSVGILFLMSIIFYIFKV